MNSHNSSYFETRGARRWPNGPTASPIRRGGRVIPATSGDSPPATVQRAMPRMARLPAENDDGTIAPTAAGGSMAFAPEYSRAGLAQFLQPLPKEHLDRVRLPGRV